MKSRILINREIADGIYLMEFEDCGIKSSGGQFVSIMIDQSDMLFRRPFSIFSHSRGAVSILYRTIGRGTKSLSELAEGAEIDVLMPLGRGFDAEAITKPLIFAAGGIGIAGINMIREQTPGILLYGDREGEYSKVLDYFNIEADYVSEQCGRKKKVTELLSEYNEGTVIACGPKPMLRAVFEVIEQRNMDYFAIYEEIMACGLGLCAGCTVKLRSGEFLKVCKDGPLLNGRELAYD